MLGTVAHAEPNQLFEIIDRKPLNEVWLNAGFYSYHFQRDKGLNDSNPGAGAEYRFSTVSSLTAGRFYNSDRKYSNYAGIYYQPVAIGKACKTYLDETMVNLSYKERRQFRYSG